MSTHKQKKLILQKHRESIGKDLGVEDIIDKLITQKIITGEEYEIIKSKPTRVQRVRCLIDIILSGTEESYDKFVLILSKDYPWLSSLLTQPIGCASESEYEDQVYQEALTMGSVPELPLHHVYRTKELKELTEKLRNLSRGHYVLIHGMPGSGKSVLAISAIRDQNLLKDCFRNRVFFIKAGEAKSTFEIANILYRLGQLIDNQFYRDKTNGFEKQDIYLMNNDLKKIFLRNDYKDALLVLDDVPNSYVIEAFNFGCKTLVTTTNMKIVPDKNTDLIVLNKGFTETESLELFSKCANMSINELPREIKKEAKQICNICKGLPLIIALIGAQIEEYQKEAKNVDRWKHYVRMIIDNKDGWLANVFRRRKHEGLQMQEYQFNTIKNCLDGLKKEYYDFYKTFVLFVEDVNITTQVLEVVLRKDKYEIEDIITELKNRSLLVYAYNEHLNCYVCGIHDLLLAHLKMMIDKKTIIELHRSLIDNYLELSGNNYANLPNDNYIFTYIGHHLLEAEREEDFPKIYFNLEFIGAKIRYAGIADLVGDFKRYKKYITQNDNPELCAKLKSFEAFVQKIGQDLYEYPHIDIIQCGLQQPTDSEVYEAAMKIALNNCDTQLYYQIQFVGQTVYVTHTLDLNEDVCSACFTNRTELILVGTNTGDIRLWDHSYKSLLKTFQGHKQKILKLQVSNDFKMFLSVSEDGIVKVWTLDNAYLRHGGKLYDENGVNVAIPSPRTRQGGWMNFFSNNGSSDDSQTLRLEGDKIHTACFNNIEHSYKVLTGSEKGMVTVWDLKTSKKNHFEVRLNKCITCCLFSENDKLVMFACDKFIFVYDLETCEYLSQLTNDVPMISLLNIPDCDNKIIAVSERTLTVWSWEESTREGGGVKLESPQKEILFEENSKDTNYICATITWDGKYLVVCSSDRYINMWNIETLEKVKEIYQRSCGMVMCLDTYLNDESQSNIMYILLTGSNDRSIRQWYIGPLETKNNVDEKLSLNFATSWNNGATPLTATISSENKIKIYNGPALITETSYNIDSPKCLTFPPNGQEIAIGYSNGLVKVFDYKSKTFRSVMNLEDEINYLEYFQSSNSILLVASSVKGCLMINHTRQSWRLKTKNNPKQKSITIKCFLLNSSEQLISVENDGCMKLWDLNGIHSVLQPNHYEDVTMVTMSTRQDKIAFTLTNGIFKLFELKNDNGKISCKFLQEKLLDKEKPLRSCCFTHDGKILAIGKNSGDIILWDTEVNKEVMTLNLHKTYVRNMFFAPSTPETPLVLVSVADQIVWWDVSYILKNLQERKKDERRKSASRRSRGSACRPENIEIDNITDDFNQMSIIDQIWKGKCGRTAKPEVLSAIKLSGDYAATISISPTFTSFVTVDSTGLMYIINVLKPKTTY